MKGPTSSSELYDYYYSAVRASVFASVRHPYAVPCHADAIITPLIKQLVPRREQYVRSPMQNLTSPCPWSDYYFQTRIYPSPATNNATAKPFTFNERAALPVNVLVGAALVVDTGLNLVIDGTEGKRLEVPTVEVVSVELLAKVLAEDDCIGDEVVDWVAEETLVDDEGGETVEECVAEVDGRIADELELATELEPELELELELELEPEFDPPGAPITLMLW